MENGTRSRLYGENSSMNITASLSNKYCYRSLLTITENLRSTPAGNQPEFTVKQSEVLFALIFRLIFIYVPSICILKLNDTLGNSHWIEYETLFFIRRKFTIKKMKPKNSLIFHKTQFTCVIWEISCIFDKLTRRIIINSLVYNNIKKITYIAFY